MPHWKKTKTTSEFTVIRKARGLYRWQKNEGWDSDITFEEGDHIAIDPMPDWPTEAACWTCYGEFVRYVTDDIAEVWIPPDSDEPTTWFRHGTGNYLIHEGYLTPQ